MKIRSGFVSNSSSSSFFVYYKPSKEITQFLKPIKKYSKEDYYSDYGFDKKNFIQIIYELYDKYKGSDENIIINEKDIELLIKQNNIFATISINHGDNELLDKINLLIKNKEINLLYKEEL
jgi:hypothetical protein